MNDIIVGVNFLFDVSCISVRRHPDNGFDENHGSMERRMFIGEDGDRHGVSRAVVDALLDFLCGIFRLWTGHTRWYHRVACVLSNNLLQWRYVFHHSFKTYFRRSLGGKATYSRIGTNSVTTPPLLMWFILGETLTMMQLVL